MKQWRFSWSSQVSIMYPEQNWEGEPRPPKVLEVKLGGGGAPPPPRTAYDHIVLINIGLIRTRFLNLRYSTFHINHFLIPLVNFPLFGNSFVIRHQVTWNKYMVIEILIPCLLCVNFSGACHSIDSMPVLLACYSLSVMFLATQSCTSILLTNK